MHAHDVYFKPKHSCWMGIFVTAEEHALLCLETEIKIKLLGQLIGTQSSNQTSNYVLQKSFSQLESGYEEIKGHQNLALPSSSSFWKSSTQGDYSSIALSFLLQTAPVSCTKQLVSFSAMKLPAGQSLQERRWHLPFPWEPVRSPREHGLSCLHPQDVLPHH